MTRTGVFFLFVRAAYHRRTRRSLLSLRAAYHRRTLRTCTRRWWGTISVCVMSMVAVRLITGAHATVRCEVGKGWGLQKKKITNQKIRVGTVYWTIRCSCPFPSVIFPEHIASRPPLYVLLYKNYISSSARGHSPPSGRATDALRVSFAERATWLGSASPTCEMAHGVSRIMRLPRCIYRTYDCEDIARPRLKMSNVRVARNNVSSITCCFGCWRLAGR